MIKIGTNADPRAAQMVYTIGKIVSAVIGLLAIYKGIDSGAKDNLELIIGGIVGLFPVASQQVAQSRVSEQRKDGTFDTLTPAEMVAKGLENAAVQQEYHKAQDQIIQASITSAISNIPVFGPIAAKAMKDMQA